MNTLAFILAGIAMILTLLSLVAGVVLMAKGGELNKKYGNKLMQARVVCQGVAIALFALALMTAK